MDFDEIWYWLSAVTFIAVFNFYLCGTFPLFCRLDGTVAMLCVYFPNRPSSRILFFLLKTKRNLQFFVVRTEEVDLCTFKVNGSGILD